MGQTTISGVLRGGQDPSLGTVEAIAAGLDVPPLYLLGESNESSSATHHQAEEIKALLIALQRHLGVTSR